MGRFSFVIFFSILSIVNSEDYGWQQASINGIVSDMEGNVFPVQGYLNGQENSAGTEQRSAPSIACFKHSAPEEKQLEQPVSSQNRRSFSFTNERNLYSTSQPFLRHENNKFKRTEIQDPFPPQLIYSKDSLPKNQVFLQETTLMPDDNFADEINIEITEPILETTTPALKMLSNQEIILSKDLEYEEHMNYDSDVDPKKKFVSQFAVAAKSSNLNLRTECANKNKIDSLTYPQRRFLEKLTYEVPSQKKLLERNNGLIQNIQVQLHENNTTIPKNNNVINDASTLNNKLPAFKLNIYKIEDSEKFLQKPNETITRQASISRNTHSNFLPKVKDPTKGNEITYLNKNSRLNLMDIDRVCYACSTENNPTCWAPDRRTTVKYCRKSDNACVTKTFGTENNLILIRDCAKTCNDDEIPGLTLKHKTCSVCYKDLCNSSYSIKVHSLIFVVPTILLITSVKSLMTLI